MRIARAVLWIFAPPFWVWACTALLVFPHAPPWARLGGAAVFAVASVLAWLKSPRAWGVAGASGPAVLVALLWSQVSPTNDRRWAAGQERMPRVTRDGDTVVIDGVRDAAWRSANDVAMRWESRRYDLSLLRSVDLVVEPFEAWRGPAHIFVTFGFADGDHVAISIEARREADEAYSILRGGFRHYELLYVIGDERDLIGMRANIRGDPVYLFPTRATPAEARELFEAMLRRATALAARPEFYHTLLSTCATNLLRHVNEVRTDKVSLLDWRMALPGYADELAWDLGLIDFNGTLAEARERFRINERSAFDQSPDRNAWSRRIRGLP